MLHGFNDLGSSVIQTFLSIGNFLLIFYFLSKKKIDKNKIKCEHLGEMWKYYA